MKGASDIFSLNVLKDHLSRPMTVIKKLFLMASVSNKHFFYNVMEFFKAKGFFGVKTANDQLHNE